MSILAILDERPGYGLQLKNEFEERTGSIWPLNVGQVYTTLARLERDRLVRQTANGDEKVYEITREGRGRLREWFEQPLDRKAPGRDELVLKLIMAVGREAAGAGDVIQAERRSAIRQLQDYTRLKRDADGDTDLGWLFLLDSLIFQTEARVRWLDACESRIRRARPKARQTKQTKSEREEVRR